MILLLVILMFVVEVKSVGLINYLLRKNHDMNSQVLESSENEGHRFGGSDDKNSPVPENLAYENLHSSKLRDREAEEAQFAQDSDNLQKKNTPANPNKPIDQASSLIELNGNYNDLNRLLNPKIVNLRFFIIQKIDNPNLNKSNRIETKNKASESEAEEKTELTNSNLFRATNKSNKLKDESSEDSRINGSKNENIKNNINEPSVPFNDNNKLIIDDKNNSSFLGSLPMANVADYSEHRLSSSPKTSRF